MQLHRKFVFIAVLASLLVADGFDYEKARMKRQTECGTNQFQCDSDECIDDWNQCDGVDNCDDGSDETAELCGSFNCPPFSFKCAYGACIYSNLQCNGVKNCKDNSDEEGCSGFLKLSLQAPLITSRLNVIPTGNDCVLPEFPDHGKWLVVGMVDLLPGDIVPANTFLLYNCQTNYRLMPDDTLSICNKTWNSLPKCIKTCPSLFGDNITLACSRDGSPASCTKPYEGTRATVRCTNSYEVPSAATGPFRFCNDGSWGNWQLKCEQVCGLKSVRAQELGVGRKDDATDLLPWNVGIYKHIEQICAGTLISPKLVLTAAHCLDSNSTEKYLVAVGKYIRALNTTSDDQAQYSKMSKIMIHERYKDIQLNYAFDIAVVVLANPFKITKHVMPVCLDFSKNFHLSSLINKVGFAVSWSFKKGSGTAAEHVKYLEMEYKTKDTCTLPSALSVYYLPNVPDKLCAGRLNQGQHPCKGDSGGGLVFPGNNGLYFLRGILSVGTRNCDEISLYTSVQYHSDLIRKLKIKKIYRYNSGDEGSQGPSTTTPVSVISPKPRNDCVLPEFPGHGGWSVLGGVLGLQPGEIVNENTILLFTCQPNYRLMPELSFVVCNKTWGPLPKCVKTCPTLSEEINLKLSCSLDGSEVSCEKPYHGTRARVSCAVFYEEPSLARRPFRFCQDGSWDYPLPNCEPVCGLKSVEVQALVISGKPAARSKFPWNVGIYKNGEYICGGSIITPKLVLTAAHCLEDSLNTENYTVAAGKYYRALNDINDDQMQLSKISNIIIHEDFNGGDPFYAFDLAVLVLSDPFSITKYVMPVCLDVSENFDLSTLNNKVGIIVGGFKSESGDSREHLKYSEVEYKTKDKCILPKSFSKYYIPYAPDKLCAGPLNQGKGACRGDSGGGLVFPSDSRRYFLRGILSVGPSGDCEVNQVSLYTSVQYHIEFIEKLKSKYRV